MTTSATPIRILRLPAVIAKSGLGRDTVYRGGKEGWFPRPVKISERASGWIESEIDEYLSARAAERGPMNEAECGPVKTAERASGGIESQEARPPRSKRTKGAEAP